jgi:hypothetical protein
LPDSFEACPTRGLTKPELTDHPVDIGQRSEAAILSELVHRGYSVLVPFGTNQRYDLVLDPGGRLVRAQCKTGRLKNGSIEFSTRSVRVNSTGRLTRDYVGQVDIFLVYWPLQRRIYAVPVAEAPKALMYLRVDPARNGQSQRVRYANDYELPA